MKKAAGNIAASVHARLLNRARATGQPFNELLQYYAMERFLYRLSLTPRPTEVVYPALLDLAAPKLLTYTPETSLAEKLHAMVVLDMANTRLKDFLDIWTLAQGQQFSGPVLIQAIGATFRRRVTSLPSSVPTAFTPAFYADRIKQTQWRAYLRKARVTGAPAELGDVVVKIHELVAPLLDALAAGRAFEGNWPPGGPWSSGP